ncbi:MAG: B12-binding domain-containing radical SAM protein [Bryobacterales bacterium]|nr:B12-binding domain-containing radical SAM protein [Bryobacterales bacterium]
MHEAILNEQRRHFCVEIVVVYMPRYLHGHETDFVPPITGIHLAALTPAEYEVRVIHQQVEAVNFETDADLIALSFFTGFAPEAYRLADEYRTRGKRVVAGGPHVTFNAEEALAHVDSVVVGEAESVWTELLRDAAAGRLRSRYTGTAEPLAGLPTPRYDLLRGRFFIPRVVQATRGCPFTCSFCTVPSISPGFRTRPTGEVIRDIEFDRFPHWWQRKVVWFWDDNLTVNRAFIRELLTAMVPLRKWWLTQASLDISGDGLLLDLMKRSGCIGIFFGIESFGAESLRDAHKPQNKVSTYQARIRELHERGICVMAGFIAGFDGDTKESVRAMARQLYETGVDVPFLSVLTPYRGTPAYRKLEEEGRILPGRGWEFYNGYNVAFRPRNMSPEELLGAHRALWREAFSLKYSALRVVRSLGRLRFGAFLMCLAMNGFYCLKRLRGNEPIAFDAPAAHSNEPVPAAGTAPGELTGIYSGQAEESVPGAWPRTRE